MMSLPLTAPDRTLPPSRMEEVADQIFAYVQPDGSWCLSNAGVLIGRDAVSLIDTAATASRAWRLREAIASITSLTPRTLVNTHDHGDHTFGNFVFAPEATIIAHERARAEMIENGLILQRLWPNVNWGEVELVLPSVTFADRLTLYVDDLRVELIYAGPAHTTNDLVAWIPDHKLLFAGDIALSGCTPFCLMGSVEGSLQALAWLRSLGARTVVCGHGPVCGPEVFEVTEMYLRWVRQLARDGINAALTPLEVARETDLGQFAALLNQERLVGNLHRAYAEELGEPLGIPLEVGLILQDMIAYNGGQLPACLA